MTLEAVNQLAPAERNRKIAEICGWKRIKVWLDGTISGWPPDKESRKEAKLSQSDPIIPNYSEDLNACAQMEQRLYSRSAVKYENRVATYCEALTDTTGGDSLFNQPSFTAYFATADQRHRAFLIVMA